MAASERTCARPPTPQVACVHQILAAGGVSGSNTMVIRVVYLFGISVGIGWYFMVFLPTDTEGKLGWYILVSKNWREPYYTH